METDAKFSFCKPKCFGRWTERRCWISYFSQLSNVLPRHSTLGKYIMSLNSSSLMPFMHFAYPASEFPLHRGVQASLHSAQLYHTAPFLSGNLFLASFLCMQMWVSALWRAGRHPVVWILVSLNIRHSVTHEKTAEKRCRQAALEIPLLFQSISMFPSLLPVSTERWQAQENAKLTLIGRQLGNVSAVQHQPLHAQTSLGCTTLLSLVLSPWWRVLCFIAAHFLSFHYQTVGCRKS